MTVVLVTGAAGVVGQALVKHLRQSGQTVEALKGRADCNLESFESATAVFERIRPNVVYHIAGAVFGVGGNKAFPGDAYRRNTLINTNVVEASRLAGVSKIVAMGSAAMYADGLSQPFGEEDVMSGEPHDSEKAYGFAKRGLLVQLEAYQQQFGMSYAFAIATNMYGPHDRFHPQYGHVIPSLIWKFDEAARAGTVVDIWGDGSPTRDFLYAEDAARGLELLMSRGEGAYNLATGVSCRIAEVVEGLAKLHPSVQYRYDPTKPLGQLRRSYTTDRIKALGFEPLRNLEYGLRETVEWYRANRESVRSTI